MNRQCLDARGECRRAHASPHVRGDKTRESGSRFTHRFSWMLAGALSVATAAACSSHPGRGANETETTAQSRGDAGAPDATAREPEPDAQVVSEPHEAAAP